MSPAVRIRDLYKFFSDVAVLRGVSVDIRRGEFFALLGPSGCGKTTLLRLIAGLEVPSRGTIFISGREMCGVPANCRPVHIVFQSYALFPHMCVLENVAYGLKISGMERRERESRAREILALVRLEGLERRMPHRLSGGQRQRVALARALVKKPEVLLLDEPLSALDAKLRASMRLELAKLREQVGITFVLVTHDREEALSVADRIAVMRSGRIEQLGTPVALYERPRSRFVADFMGEATIIEGRVRRIAENALWMESCMGILRVCTSSRTFPALGERITVALRPEKITLHRVSKSDVDCSCEAGLSVHRIFGVVHERSYLGGSFLCLVKSGRAFLKVSCAGGQNEVPLPGDEVSLTWRPQDMIILET